MLVNNGEMSVWSYTHFTIWTSLRSCTDCFGITLLPALQVWNGCTLLIYIWTLGHIVLHFNIRDFTIRNQVLFIVIITNIIIMIFLCFLLYFLVAPGLWRDLELSFAEGLLCKQTYTMLHIDHTDAAGWWGVGGSD